MKQFQTLLAAGLAVCLAAPAWAQSDALPQREGDRPKTTNGVPHVQIGVEFDKALNEALLERVAKFPGVSLGQTRVSLPGAVGFQLDRDMQLAHPEVIMGGLEFAHMHPDGSLHASLSPDLAKTAIAAGWAVSHPWSNQRAGLEGFVMIYSPTTQAELEVVFDLVQSSYNYVTGHSL